MEVCVKGDCTAVIPVSMAVRYGCGKGANVKLVHCFASVEASGVSSPGGWVKVGPLSFTWTPPPKAVC